jgi:hypothetical protein
MEAEVTNRAATFVAIGTPNALVCTAGGLLPTGLACDNHKPWQIVVAIDHRIEALIENP